MIVNLAVADGDHAALRVRHWLVGLICETTNGEARRTQDGQVGVHLAGGIRAAVRQGSEHCLYAKMSGVGRPEAGKSDIAADATHFSNLSGLAVGCLNHSYAQLRRKIRVVLISMLR